ncbi:Cell wall-binding protein YocH precursor [compost metagenome]
MITSRTVLISVSAYTMVMIVLVMAGMYSNMVFAQEIGTKTSTKEVTSDISSFTLVTTKLKPLTKSISDFSMPPSPVTPAKEVKVLATAYTADCEGCSGITYTGIDVRKNTPKIIAVDPTIIPLKHKVEVIVDGVSMGEYETQDTGGAIKQNRIDILMKTVDEANKFGRKPNTIVRILGEV